MGNMSDRPTLPPSATEQEKASLAEQVALTAACTKHAEPHVRLIAHMSERQLMLSERVTDVVDTLRALLKEVKGAREDLAAINEKLSSLIDNHGALEDRVDELEAVVVP